MDLTGDAVSVYLYVHLNVLLCCRRSVCENCRTPAHATVRIRQERHPDLAFQTTTMKRAPQPYHQSAVYHHRAQGEKAGIMAVPSPLGPVIHKRTMSDPNDAPPITLVDC